MLEALWLATTLAGASIEEITVVARRRENLLEVPVAVSTVLPEAGVVHPNRLFDAVPGTWVSRGSGQEHLTAIRSPVLTGAGACGAFLYLEDGLPIRPPGLCNVNNLFEIDLSQADQVEVLRGPAPATYGSNGLHGVINVVPRLPRADDKPEIALWAGPDDYRQLLGSASGAAGGGAGRLEFNGVSTGSFRDLEGYDQQKVRAGWRGTLGGQNAGVTFAATSLNQETAGFILGRDAYRDAALRTGNLNPEAFRDAWAARLAAQIEIDRGEWRHLLRPFARSSSMRFLQHFLPGKPLEENGQDSVGLQWMATRSRGEQRLTAGLDVDVANGDLREFQSGPTEGSAFLRETRPSGLHYDYSVRAATVALFATLDMPLVTDLNVHLGLRAERSSYDYENLTLTGNTRQDGSTCGFGGCLYSRPASREDSFTDIAPKLGATWRMRPGHWLYLRGARGFRAPQATELYRLQRGQSVADLDSEKADSGELGWRWSGDAGRLELAIWYLSKRNFIFRDAEGLNVSDGRTRHRGLEWRWGLDLAPRWRLEQSASYSIQRYAFSRQAGGGETIVRGNEVDTAPRWLARTALAWDAETISASLEWLHQDEYFLDAANSGRYPGHDLLHLSLTRKWPGWSLSLRIDNLLNERYAERADFAFGNFRYFPGAGRQLFAGLSWRP